MGVVDKNDEPRLKKDILIKVRMTEEDLRIIDERMKESGLLTRSEYLRKAATRPCVVSVPITREEDFLQPLNKITSELNAIGRNLNQTVRKLYSFEMDAREDALTYTMEKLARQVRECTDVALKIEKSIDRFTNKYSESMEIFAIELGLLLTEEEVEEARERRDILKEFLQIPMEDLLFVKEELAKRI